MNVSIAGEAAAFLQDLVERGQFNSPEAAANSLLLSAKSQQDQHIEWLRSEIDKGLQSGIMTEGFDPQNLDAFWDDIEALSDEKIKTDSINYDSAALPPL